MCNGIDPDLCLECELSDIEHNASCNRSDAIELVVERIDDCEFYDRKTITAFRKQLIAMGWFVQIEKPDAVQVLHNGQCRMMNRFEYAFRIGQRYYVEAVSVAE